MLQAARFQDLWEHTRRSGTVITFWDRYFGHWLMHWHSVVGRKLRQVNAYIYKATKLVGTRRRDYTFFLFSYTEVKLMNYYIFYIEYRIVRKKNENNDHSWLLLKTSSRYQQVAKAILNEEIWHETRMTYKSTTTPVSAEQCPPVMGREGKLIHDIVKFSHCTSVTSQLEPLHAVDRP